MKSGQKSSITASQLLGVDSDIVTSRYPNKSLPCLIWVTQDVNNSVIDVLNTYFDSHWYFAYPGLNTYDGLKLLSSLEDVNNGTYGHIVIVNSVANEITDLTQVNIKLKYVLNRLKLLPQDTPAKYIIINHYPARTSHQNMNVFANRLVHWLDLGCYAFLSEHLQVKPVSLRVGFLQSQLVDFVEDVHAQILIEHTLNLSDPFNELPYVSNQQLCDAINQIVTQPSRLSAGKFYVETSNRVVITKLIERLILAAGKSSRVDDTQQYSSNEILIRFDERKSVEPMYKKLYWADNVTGTYFPELIAYDACYLSSKQFSHLTYQLYYLIDINDEKGAISLLDEPNRSTITETVSNVVNVSFRDVFR